MWCIITLPNSVVLEKEVDQHCIARQVLDQVCEHLGVIEKDYFGLVLAGSKNEGLWLNLRNPIGRQLRTGGCPPYRLQLCVKFYVQPHYILQAATRSLFYDGLKNDLTHGRLHLVTKEEHHQLAALVSQVQHGDVRNNYPLLNKYQEYLQEEASMEDLEDVRRLHVDLKGSSPTNAQNQFLKEISQTGCYGQEFYEVRNDGAQTGTHLGVGPDGIAVYDKNWILSHRIEYPSIQKAVNSGKMLNLQLVQDNGSVHQQSYKLGSERHAQALYRCITEMYSFYHCDNVRNAVSAQFVRDLKGTFASLFDENTSTGKKYVFDIERTLHEACDSVRRQLYEMETRREEDIPDDNDDDVQSENCEMSEDKQCNSQRCLGDKERLVKMEDAYLCCVCKDGPISCAFFPCRHVVCCSACSNQLNNCPICRTEISSCEKLFLPSILTSPVT